MNIAILRCIRWLAAACILVSGFAMAQGFPSRPLTLLYTSTPGSSADSLHRAMVVEWSKRLGQPVVFENRPGASGRLGLQAFAKSRGDGHVLTAINSGVATTLVLIEPTTFDMQPGRDYVPVSFTFSSPYIMVAHPAVPFRDVRGLIAYARANPGKLNFANTGMGSTIHLGAELMRTQASIDFVHVPFRENLFPSLINGDVQLVFTSAGQAKPLIDSGRLVALATTGPQRWNQFPNLPTMQEEGLKGYDMSFWFGIAAPAQTPRDVIARLNDVMNATIRIPAITARIHDYGGIENPMTPESFSGYIRADLDRWGPVVKTVGVKQD